LRHAFGVKKCPFSKKIAKKIFSFLANFPNFGLADLDKKCGPKEMSRPKSVKVPYLQRFPADIGFPGKRFRVSVQPFLPDFFLKRLTQKQSGFPFSKINTFDT
jgi:hypothetical protein